MLALAQPERQWLAYLMAVLLLHKANGSVWHPVPGAIVVIASWRLECHLQHKAAYHVKLLSVCSTDTGTWTHLSKA